MSVSIILRGLSRNCLRAGSNGVIRNPLSPELCRAFAVAPFRAAIASSNFSTQQQNTTAPTILSRVPSVQHSVSRSSSSGDHVNLWKAERVLSVVLLGAIPAAIVMPTPAVETVLALAITVHGHWGIEALVHDYIRPAVFGNIIPRVSVATLYAITVMTFGSLCYFIYTDVGIVNAVSMLWKL